MSTVPIPTVLTIAGFDPSSGAGVTADLLVFAAHGLFATACITSLTVQSTLGVRSSHPVHPQIVADTLACLHEDLPPAGIKIGMLGNAETVEAVSAYVQSLRERGPKTIIVLDPVLRSSTGRELLDPHGLEMLRLRLLPMVDWITPNLEELSVLSAQESAESHQIEASAKGLQALLGGAVNILVTGGHLDPPNDLLLTAEGNLHWLRGELIATTSTHGTGCALSSAVLSRLVLGDDALTAAQGAKRYVAEALRSATPVGRGNGPMNHLWPLCRP